MRRVLIVSPAPPGSSLGNAVTAQRYARIFRSLGCRATIAASYDGRSGVDVLVALHARKSAESVLRFARERPTAPIVLVLTGTDVYRDIRRSRMALRAMRAADAIVTLQPDAIRRVPAPLRAKTTPIVQSAPTVPHRPHRGAALQVCVLGHLRFEKDPMRAAYALRYIEPSVPIRIVQAGAALDARFARAAQRVADRDARYEYLGELTRARARSLLARSDLMVLSSRMEGGANVACEAIAAGTPVLASRISGNIGIFGKTYPGYFPAGDTAALARMLMRARDPSFISRLRAHCEALRPLVDPERERSAWKALFARLRFP